MKKHGRFPDDATAFNDEHGYPRILPEPKNSFQATMRKLAEEAMSCTHHDINHDEPEAIHEIINMERRFARILKGKLKPMPRPALSTTLTTTGTKGRDHG